MRRSKRASNPNQSVVGPRAIGQVHRHSRKRDTNDDQPLSDIVLGNYTVATTGLVSSMGPLSQTELDTPSTYFYDTIPKEYSIHGLHPDGTLGPLAYAKILVKSMTRLIIHQAILIRDVFRCSIFWVGQVTCDSEPLDLSCNSNWSGSMF